LKASIAAAAIQQAAASDLTARESAEDLIAEAEAAAAVAKRAEGDKAHAHGGVRATGLRSFWTAEVTNSRDALLHYLKADRPAFDALVQRLAQQDVANPRRRQDRRKSPASEAIATLAQKITAPEGPHGGGATGNRTHRFRREGRLMGNAGTHWTAERRAKALARFGTPEERFLQNIQPDLVGGCWLWTGTLIKSTGYGQLQVGDRGIGAHRFSWEMVHGPITDGLHVLHKCDVRACVNPTHLFLGTAADNNHDMHQKGRARVMRGDGHVGAKLSSTDIPGILKRLADGETCIAIANDFGLTDCAINAIRRGKSWTHVTGIAPARAKAAAA
jgi:hypothetical protein